MKIKHSEIVTKKIKSLVYLKKMLKISVSRIRGMRTFIRKSNFRMFERTLEQDFVLLLFLSYRNKNIIIVIIVNYCPDSFLIFDSRYVKVICKW